MKFPQSIVVASMLVATACGAPKTNQAHLMAQGLGDPGVVILHGSEADQFTKRWHLPVFRAASGI